MSENLRKIQKWKKRKNNGTIIFRRKQKKGRRIWK